MKNVKLKKISKFISLGILFFGIGLGIIVKEIIKPNKKTVWPKVPVISKISNLEIAESEITRAEELTQIVCLEDLLEREENDLVFENYSGTIKVVNCTGSGCGAIF